MAKAMFLKQKEIKVPDEGQGKQKSFLYHMLDSIMTYIWINLTAVVSLLFFKVLNRTEVIGTENLPANERLLLCSNHQTMIDSFLIGTFAFFPRVLIKPALLPYHPAAFENFFKGRVMSWMSKKWRCIPVKRGERDMFALSQMIQTLKSGTMVIFPEGTRSRTGQVGAGRVGVGKLIHDTKSVVIPVAVHGMDRVLPIGAACPRIFQKIRIIFGEPIDLDEYYAMEVGKQTSRLIVDKVIDDITELYGYLGTLAYIDKAKKISQHTLRDQELAEFASVGSPKREESFSFEGQTLNQDAQSSDYLHDEQIH